MLRHFLIIAFGAFSKIAVACSGSADIEQSDSYDFLLSVL